MAMCDPEFSMSLSEVPDYTARSSQCIEQDSQIHTSLDELDLRRKYTLKLFSANVFL